MVGRVFISYRRDDSAGGAGRVHDRLEREFGSGLLFMDVDLIPLGVNFTKVLRDEVAKCEVLLAVIGPNWLNASDEEGHRRLDSPNDFVRIEISTALQRNIPVIPILLDGATIPKANQLPKDLRELGVRNGLEVRHASFHSDMEKLIRGLKSPLGRINVSAAVPLPSEGHEAEASRKAEEEHKRKRAEASTEAERRTREERSRRDEEAAGRVEDEGRQGKVAAEAFASEAEKLPAPPLDREGAYRPAESNNPAGLRSFPPAFPKNFGASQVRTGLRALQPQSWWPLPRSVMATSGALAVVIIAVLYWVENTPPVSPQQVWGSHLRPPKSRHQWCRPPSRPH